MILRSARSLLHQMVAQLSWVLGMEISASGTLGEQCTKRNASMPLLPHSRARPRFQAKDLSWKYSGMIGLSNAIHTARLTLSSASWKLCETRPPNQEPVRNILRMTYAQTLVLTCLYLGVSRCGPNAPPQFRRHRRSKHPALNR